jgi:hypothetical protein
MPPRQCVTSNLESITVADEHRTEETIALLPCPFCAKPDTVCLTDSTEFHVIDCECRDIDDGNCVSYAVVCDARAPGGPGGCGASGGFAVTKAKAVEKWNRRPT